MITIIKKLHPVTMAMAPKFNGDNIAIDLTYTVDNTIHRMCMYACMCIVLNLTHEYKFVHHIVGISLDKVPVAVV